MEIDDEIIIAVAISHFQSLSTVSTLSTLNNISLNSQLSVNPHCLTVCSRFTPFYLPCTSVKNGMCFSLFHAHEIVVLKVSNCRSNQI